MVKEDGRGIPLSAYKEITALGKHENVWLVYEESQGKVYVKKCLEVFNRKIYEWLKDVSNPHIPHILLCEEDKEKLYIIEEYINGKTLEEYLESAGCLTEEETLPILIGLAQALSFLHRQNPPVIHRDVKLSNVILSSDGVVKLIDYNAARYYGMGMTQDTKLIGTASYAAPEQFGFAQTDARTDIYAFGVVMNYLLTGEHVRHRLYEGRWGKVILRCTHMDPEKRFQKIEQVEAAIVRGSISFPKADIVGSILAAWDMVKSFGMEIGWKIWDRLWPIPGFRTSCFWKEAIAVIGYLAIYGLVVGMQFEKNPGGVWLGIQRICVGISSLFFVALITDYGGISRVIPLIRHEKISMRILGCFIFGFIGLRVMMLFYLYLEGKFGP